MDIMLAKKKDDDSNIIEYDYSYLVMIKDNSKCFVVELFARKKAIYFVEFFYKIFTNSKKNRKK